MQIPKYTTFLAVSLIVMSCTGKYRNTDLEEKFRSIAVSYDDQNLNSIHEFSLDSLTNFDWDEAYIFQGNTNGIGLDYISENIGAKWVGEDVEDEHIRLIFLKDKRVVSSVDFDRADYNLWFTGCELSDNVPKEEAVQKFSREKDNQFSSFLYWDMKNKVRYFVPSRCFKNWSEEQRPNCE